MKNKYASPKYSMSINLQTTKHHPWGEGAHTRTVGELLKQGHNASKNWAHVAKDAQELSNINKKQNPAFSAKMKTVARQAREKAYAEGDYKGQCQTCKIVHRPMRARMYA